MPHTLATRRGARQRALSLGGVLLAGLCGAGAHGGAPQAVCVLGWPGVEGRFALLADGSVRVGRDGPRVLEVIDPGAGGRAADVPASPADLSWMAPGVRVVRAAREVDGLALASLSGADLHGRPKPSLWLFRAITLTNTEPRRRTCRLGVGLCCDSGEGDLAVRRDSVVTEGGQVRLVASLKADETRVSAEPREVWLWFDLDIPPEAFVELLLAVPGVSLVHDEADAPDVRHLRASEVMQRIALRWQQRVIPETVTVGDPLVNLSLHAAIGSLMLSPPGEGAEATEVAAWISAAARVGQGSLAAGLVESLIQEREPAAGPPIAADLAGHADLVAALADYARYSDAPDRMCRILWAPLSAAVAELAERSGAPLAGGTRARVSLALSEASSVARFIGRDVVEGEWRERADELLRPEGAGAPGAPPLTGPFATRAYAGQLASHGGSRLPAVTDPGIPLTELLARAHLAVLAGPPEDRELAWQTVEQRLAAQALPGVRMTDEGEDVLAAAQLLALISDSIVRSDSHSVHLLPAVPADWAHDGLLLALQDYPSGAGPLDLSMSLRRARATVEPLTLPGSAAQVSISPPLGVQTIGLGVNGRPLEPAAFQGGPPWQLDANAERIVMRLSRAAAQ